MAGNADILRWHIEADTDTTERQRQIQSLVGTRDVAEAGDENGNVRAWRYSLADPHAGGIDHTVIGDHERNAHISVKVDRELLRIIYVDCEFLRPDLATEHDVGVGDSEVVGRGRNLTIH